MADPVQLPQAEIDLTNLIVDKVNEIKPGAASFERVRELCGNLTLLTNPQRKDVDRQLLTRVLVGLGLTGPEQKHLQDALRSSGYRINGPTPLAAAAAGTPAARPASNQRAAHQAPAPASDAGESHSRNFWQLPLAILAAAALIILAVVLFSRFRPNLPSPDLGEEIKEVQKQPTPAPAAPPPDSTTAAPKSPATSLSRDDLQDKRMDNLQAQITQKGAEITDAHSRIGALDNRTHAALDSLRSKTSAVEARLPVPGRPAAQRTAASTPQRQRSAAVSTSNQRRTLVTDPATGLKAWVITER